MDNDKDKNTSAVQAISAETLDKLASRDDDIRQSGLIDIFEQHLPTIPKDYVFKNRDRQFVADAINAAFDLTGGVPRLIKYGHENYAEFIKLWARMLPEPDKKEQGSTVVQIIHNVPQSPLDLGDIIDADDGMDDE